MQKDLDTKEKIKPFDLIIHKGEVIGLTGLALVQDEANLPE